MYIFLEISLIKQNPNDLSPQAHNLICKSRKKKERKRKRKRKKRKRKRKERKNKTTNIELMNNEKRGKVK